MRIKSIIAPNLEKAMAQIKEEIGPSALILETRECEGKGFKGFLGKNLIEVVVAYPEEDEEDEDGGDDIFEEDAGNSGVGTVSGDVGGVVSQSKMLSLLNERFEKGRQDVEPVKEFSEFKNLLLNSGAVDNAVLPDNSVNLPDSSVNVAFDIETVNKNNLLDEMDIFRQELLDQELQEKIVDHVLQTDGIEKQAKKGDVDIVMKKAEARKRLSNLVKTKKIIENGDNSTKNKIITFVGPTGVGKTTTLAKVAAKLALDNGKSVGMITIDTYRIGAVDQLTAYADMMDVPIMVAFSVKDLSAAINKFNDKDFILIDTVGRSQYDGKRVRMLKGLLKALPSPENYLVINAGARSREANDIFTNFNILPVHGLIFSKIDETKTFGMMLNMAATTKLPVCYLTNGQEVPDDIMDANADEIADLIVPFQPEKS